MSRDTTLWIEYKEEKHWRGIEKHAFSYNSLPAVLAKMAENQSRPGVTALSQDEIRTQLPEDVSQEVLAEAKLLPDPGSGIIALDIGWLLLSELVLFDWNAVWRIYPFYQDTYADIIG